MCAVLRERWQNAALPADVVEEGSDGSPALESGNFSAMTSNPIVGGDCVRDVDLNPSLTWEAGVDTLEIFLFLLFPLQMLYLSVL